MTTKVRGEPKNDAITAFGMSPEEEYTFLLVPVAVYALVSDIARQQGCSVGEVFQRSLLQYLQASQAPRERAPDQQPNRPAPDIALKRRRP